MNEIVPESPDKESDGEDENAYIPETPQKDGSPLIKTQSIIPIPSFNRIRKSLGVLGNNVEYDPRTDSPKSRSSTGKRKSSSASKKSPRSRCFKDKYSNLQKVKVSLFHNVKESKSKKPSFSVNAKSFYGSSNKIVPVVLTPTMVKPENLQNSKKTSPVAQCVKKKSVAAQPAAKKRSPPQASVLRKHKERGEINCGVGHGITKPKRKRSSLKNDSFGSDKSSSDRRSGSLSEVHIPIEINVNRNIPIEINVNHSENVDTSNVIQSSNVEVYNPKRKFFKHVRHRLGKPVNSSAIVSLPAESETIELLVNKYINKKPRMDELGIQTAKTVNESSLIDGAHEYLGLSEKNGELVIQPLVNQKDIDDWNKLTEDASLNILDTNISNLESFNQVEDLLKILEEDWVDPMEIQTISMNAVNGFSLKESNNILENESSGIESTSINNKSNNIVCQSTEDSVPNDIQDVKSCNETITNFGLNDTVSLSEKLSLSASIKTKSGNRNLLSCKSVNEEVSNNMGHLSKINIEPLDQNTTASVFQKDKYDLISILQDNWVEDPQPKGNLTSTENNILSLTESNQNIYNSMVTSNSIMNPMNKSMESQNGEEAKNYYSIFSKGSISYTVTDTKKKHKKHSGNRIPIKYTSDPKQYQIDAGQNLFGVIQCKECQVTYHLGDKEDERYHKKFHNQWEKNSTFKFQGWKNERIIFQDLSTKSKIILIDTSDPMSHKKKVLDILEIIDVGLAEIDTSDYIDDKIYCYIRNKSIIGLLISKRIHKAFRMISESQELNCCSSESSPAKCGIEVIWTAELYRRQGIATELVDILRKNYFYGYVMSIEDIAFSIPTPSGKAFAEKYTKTSSFKVY